MAAMSVTDIYNYRCLNCKNCCMPIMLLAEKIQPLFADPERLPNQHHAIVARCGTCKSVETYILHPQIEGYNPKDRPMGDTLLHGDTVRVTNIECVAERCGILLPLFAVWTPSTTEEERLAEISTWRWENLKCPKGHSIPKPDWSFYGVA